jgi:hypothetical protein
MVNGQWSMVNGQWSINLEVKKLKNNIIFIFTLLLSYPNPTEVAIPFGGLGGQEVAIPLQGLGGRGVADPVNSPFIIVTYKQ